MNSNMENNSINNNYTLEIEVLSPLHIGAGSEKNWVETADFVFDGNKVYKLNQRKVIEKIGIEQYSSILINRNSKELKNKLSGEISKYADEYFENPGVSGNDIKAHIRTGLNNKPYVPGSSLKGAIRSVLLNYFEPDKKIRNNNELNKSIFGSASDGDEFMRFVKISDAHFKKTKLVNTKIFNLKSKGNKDFFGTWKPDHFDTIYETIETGQKAMLVFSLSESLLKKFDLRKFYETEKKNAKNSNELQKISNLENLVEDKTKIISSKINYLFKIINDRTAKYIEKEIKFFKDNSNKGTESIIDSLDNIKKQIPPDNTYCILRMASGSGFHSITGDWKLESHDINNIVINGRSRGRLNNENSAKSRKIAIHGNNFMPMGFIKLTHLTEELKAKLQEEKERLQEKIRQRELKEEAEKAEKIRLQKQKEYEAGQEKLRLEEERTKAEQACIAEEKRREEERLTALRKDEEQREALKQEKQKTSREQGIDVSAIMPDKRDSWDKLKKSVERFVEDLYREKYKKVLENKDYGVLPETEHAKIMETVLIIFQSLKKKEKQNWKKPYTENATLKKIAEWIGKEKAENIFMEDK